MATGTYKLEIDWDNDGTFAAGEDTTADWLGEPATIERGRDVGNISPIGGLLAAKATFTLANDDAKYHPENSGSSLAGDLVPGRDIKITTTAPTAAGLFRGFLTDFRVHPNPDEQSVSMVALGGLHWLKNQTVGTDLFRGISTGEAIGEVLDAAGWDAGRRDLDTGSSVLPIWWAAGNALDALQALLLAEGPGAMLFENGDGDIVFHDRQHRLMTAASITSQATFRATGTEPVFAIPHEYEAGWDGIINDASIEISTYQKQPLDVVWTYPGGSIALNASQSRSYLAALPTAAEDMIAPVAATDYVVASGSITSATITRTSGSRTKIELTAGGSGAVVTGLQLRGQIWDKADSYDVINSDLTREPEFGLRSLDESIPWIDENTARDVMTFVVNDYQNPLPRVRIVVTNGHATRLTNILTREINDRVTVIDAASGMNREFWIERIEHDITEAGKSHRVIYDCVAVPDNPLVTSSDVFLFGDATQGKFGTGKFGY